jgi:hypothetical protein
MPRRLLMAAAYAYSLLLKGKKEDAATVLQTLTLAESFAKCKGRRKHMFETLAIRTLMVCGVVTLMTLMTQQLLGENPLKITVEQKPPPVVDVLEGGKGMFLLKIQNISKENVDLSFDQPLMSRNVELGEDQSDNLTLTSDVPKGHTLLTPNESGFLNVTFSTPGKTPGPPPGPPEDIDTEHNVIEVSVFQGSTFGDQRFSENVTVTDPVVPEPSTLVLVGVCALSVCGVGWLRRRRILSKA